MQITCFDDLVQAARQRSFTCAVVCAHEETTLASIVHAKRQGVANGVLIGNRDRISKMLVKLGAEKDDFEIIDAQTTDDALFAAVDVVNSGRAGALMKGAIETGEFLKAVLDRKNNLRSGGLLSAIGLYETPNYHKLFAVSDFAMNIAPDVEGKRKIIENAVRLLHKLGIAEPKVAVLSETERVNPKIQASVDSHELKMLWEAGKVPDCIIEGPIAFDLAMQPEASKIKGYSSPVAGDADLLIVPEIVSGNILVKCLTEIAGAQTAGIVLGAKIPVIMTSRSARDTDKYYSIALAAAAGGDMQ